MICSVCYETEGVKLIKVEIGRGKTQEIPYCRKHAAYLKPTCQQNESENIIAYCCGRPVNPKSGRCSTCGDQY